MKAGLVFTIPFHYWNIFCTDTRFFCGIGRFQETTEVFSGLSKRIKPRQNVYMRLFLFTALAAFLVFPACPAFADIAGRASVIDGDTIEIRGQRIRLWGIDAPESRQTCERNGQAWRCGQTASFALADKIGARPVTCKQRDKDRYRRIVAVCFLQSEDLNGWMVRQGIALDYRQYSKGRYRAEESEARTNKRGVWGSKFMKPWEWRRKKSR